MPKADEFWICNIISEFKTGCVKGCFLVDPVEKVAYEDLVSLTPLNCTLCIYNFCKTGKGGSTIVVNPETPKTKEGKSIPWLLNLTHKTHLKTKEIIAIVVNLGGSFWIQN